jgi:transposase
MIGQKNQRKSARRRCSPEFKTKALGLAEQIGAACAARELGLHESQFNAWRKKVCHEVSRARDRKGTGNRKRQIEAPTGQERRRVGHIKRPLRTSLKA